MFCNSVSDLFYFRLLRNLIISVGVPMANRKWFESDRLTLLLMKRTLSLGASRSTVVRRDKWEKFMSRKRRLSNGETE